MVQNKDYKDSKEKDLRDRRIIIKGNLVINYAMFKKTRAEKLLLKEVVKKYNENKRKVFKSFFKRNANFGLISNNLKDIASMLKRADMIEIEIASLK
jgi:hypothetical protein